MKRLAIMLTGLTLILGGEVTQATAGSYASSSVAISSNDQQPLLDDHRSDATLVFNTDPDADDEGLYACQPTTVLGYAISPKVTIDLQCRLFPSKENSSEFVSEQVDVDQVTRNLMLGFSYKF